MSGGGSNADVTLSVGFPGGFGSSGADGSPSLLVRMGGLFHRLDPDSYDLWWQVAHHASARDLIAWAEGDGLKGPKERFSKLVENRLIVGFEPSNRQAFFRHYRLLTNGIGTGQDQDDERLHTIRGHDMNVLVQVDSVVYAVWLASDGRRSMAEACSTVADDLSIDVSAVQARVADAIVPLAKVAAVFLDTAGPVAV